MYYVTDETFAAECSEDSWSSEPTRSWEYAELQGVQHLETSHGLPLQDFEIIPAEWLS